jgi:hypothetical protein
MHTEGTERKTPKPAVAGPHPDPDTAYDTLHGSLDVNPQKTRSKKQDSYEESETYLCCHVAGADYGLTGDGAVVMVRHRHGGQAGPCTPGSRKHYFLPIIFNSRLYCSGFDP